MKKLPSYLPRVILRWWTSLLWAVNTASVTTSVCLKARHTEKVSPANQELRAIQLGDICWQSSCIGCPGKTCLRCRNVHTMVQKFNVPWKAHRVSAWLFRLQAKSEQLKFHKPHPSPICTMPHGWKLSSFSRVSPRHSFSSCSGGSSHIPKT